MKHTLQIHVAKNPKDVGLMACRRIPIRERLLRLLLGKKTCLTVIIPGDTVEQVSIREVATGGAV